MNITVKQEIKFDDLVAVLEILSGMPFVAYEILTFERTKSVPVKVLTGLWGAGSAIDVAFGLVYLLNRAGMKIHIPEYMKDTKKLITSVA
jgi:hypothetical protein